MSRIGKKTIDIPTGIDVTFSSGILVVKGPKGTTQRPIPDWLGVKVDGNILRCSPLKDVPEVAAQWGLHRMLIDNMVRGVAVGYRKRLEIIGIGYKAEMKGRDLVLYVGYSHPVTIKAPPGITISLEEQNKAFRVNVDGVDREKVGQIAADIRQVRPTEPYQGKGIRYEGEFIIRKVGKAAGK